jgi:hypothetical protein
MSICVTKKWLAVTFCIWAPKAPAPALSVLFRGLAPRLASPLRAAGAEAYVLQLLMQMTEEWVNFGEMVPMEPMEWNPKHFSTGNKAPPNEIDTQ